MLHLHQMLVSMRTFGLHTNPRLACPPSSQRRQYPWGFSCSAQPNGSSPAERGCAAMALSRRCNTHFVGQMGCPACHATPATELQVCSIALVAWDPWKRGPAICPAWLLRLCRRCRPLHALQAAGVAAAPRRRLDAHEGLIGGAASVLGGHPAFLQARRPLTGAVPACMFGGRPGLTAMPMNAANWRLHEQRKVLLCWGRWHGHGARSAPAPASLVALCERLGAQGHHEVLQHRDQQPQEVQEGKHRAMAAGAALLGHRGWMPARMDRPAGAEAAAMEAHCRPAALPCRRTSRRPPARAGS